VILFAGGDVGGCRALLPVIHACKEKNLPFAVLAHGHMLKENAPDWPMPAPPSDKDSLEDWLGSRGVTLILFASSVHDTLPLTLARAGQRAGLPVIHVLDNWSSYRNRLENDGLPPFMPDHYALMDEMALKAAMKEGLPENMLVITGQPALAGLADSAARHPAPVPQKPFSLLFVSEPAEADQGSDPGNPAFRGYTEKDVLRLLCAALQPWMDDLFLHLLPHPREERSGLAAVWEENRGGLKGRVLDQATAHGREEVLKADGIMGMTSILLYEAWLLGKPVLSFQPGLRQQSLAQLASRPGVFFTDKKKELSPLLSLWLGTPFHKPPVPRKDLTRHSQAASRILDLAMTCLKKTQIPTRTP